MRFHQVKELVEWAADYHQRLAEQYSLMAVREGTSERVRLALEYLAGRELKQQKALLGYLEDGNEHAKVLEGWFSDPADIHHLPVLERLPNGLSRDNLQAVLTTALAGHRTLQDLYAHRAELTRAGDQRDFFEALSADHEAEVRRIVRDIQRLEDY